MTTTNVFVNSVVRYGQSKRFRLIAHLKADQSPIHAESWVAIGLDEENPLPIVWRADKFKEQLELGHAMPVEEPEVEVPAEACPADAVIQAKRWGRLVGLLRPERDSVFFGRMYELWDKKKRNALLKEYGEYLGVSSKTLLHDLRLYWTGGQTQDSLRGDYWRCGRLTEDMDGVIEVKVVGEKGHKVKLFAPGKGSARGRRPNDQSYEPFVMTAPIRKAVIKMARKEFLKDERYSVRCVSDTVVRKMFAVRDESGKIVMSKNEPGEAELLPLGSRPTEDQVRYIIRSVVSAAVARKSRVSEADFDNNHAPSTGTVLDDCTGAGDIYEIDSTEVDLWLVARYDRALIIGLPTLYLVVDRYTNLIVGFYASLEPAKWEECKQAVLSICGDWESLCKRYKVTYIPEAFPARGLFPNRWVGDRGDFLCYGSDILTHELRQQASNLASQRARKKCRVEGGFHTNSVVLKDNAHGYKLPRNATKRRGKKWEKDASLNFDDFMRIYLEIVIAHNLKAATPKVLDPKFLSTGKKPSPVNLWNHDIATNSGALAKIGYEKARRALMPTDVAKVTDGGIEFRGLVYEFDESKKLGWFSEASLLGVDEVKVAYSPSLVDTILIQDNKDATKTYAGKLTKTYARYFSGYSFAEVDGYVKKYGALKTTLNKTSKLASRAAVAETVSGVSEQAYQEMKEATKGMSLAARKAGGQAAWEMEMRDGRRAMHDVTKTPSSTIGAVLDEPEGDAVADTDGADTNSEGVAAAPKKKGGKRSKPSRQPSSKPRDADTSAHEPASTAVVEAGLDDLIAALELLS